jgi:cytosine/adenosine deaminase-related metal-dependent hydrolase
LTNTTLQLVEDKGKTPLTVGPTVEEAFNLCTILGARALKQGDKIGSIAEGKLADLVIFDANSPAMVCATVHDPVAAIVLHSSPADVETVIVDGIVRKKDARLVDVKLDDETGKNVAGKELLRWKDVAENLLRTRERIQAEAEKIDFKAGERKVMQMFGVAEDELQDP